MDFGSKFHQQETVSSGGWGIHKGLHPLDIKLGHLFIHIWMERERFSIRNWLMWLIIKDAKSQDLQSANWRPKRADSIVLSLSMAGSRPRKSRCFSLSPKSGKKPQCSNSKAVKLKEFPFFGGRVSPFVLFKPSTVRVRPTTLGRAICLYSVYKFK